jgi:hypothetical protein
MLLIKDEEEACEEVGPLVVPEPPEEVIVIFLGEKDIDKLVTQSQNQIGIIEALVEGFLGFPSFFQFQRKDQIQGTHLLFILMNEIEWS